ncbi:MAG: NAD+ synthase [Gemmatimonadaceae bacterium]
MSHQLAIAQFAPSKGDYPANLHRLGELFAQNDALSPRAQLLCLPESALTGYFLEGGVRDVAMTAGALASDLNEIYRSAVKSPRMLDVALGFYEQWDRKLYNSALYVTLGGAEPVVRHVHRKLFLPTYGMFDEERFVDRGREVRAFDTDFGRMALLVCEDAWHSLTGAIAALDGAQVILLLAAPPARGPWADTQGVPASVNRWERLARDIAEEHGVFVALANLVGSEGGKIFPGASMLMGPKGDLRVRGPLWEEALVTSDVDLEDVSRARADMPLIADLEVMMPHLVSNIARIEMGAVSRPDYDGRSGESATSAGARARGGDGRKKSSSASRSSGAPVKVVAAQPFTPPLPLDIDPALTEQWLAYFIKSEMEQRGFGKALVGISGGVDSAVTAYLAAKTLGLKNVIGVRMPYRSSSRDSMDHAQLVIDALGIESCTVDISAAVDGYLERDPDAEAGRRGNVMARMRMIVLFDLSAKLGAIPLGTGNKTERLFGYFTWHADDAPPINPLGDLFKSQVWALARHLGVPARIVDKPPTADLVVGQTDEADFGISYQKADEILNWILAGYKPAELVARGFVESEVTLVATRLASTHWKRRLPTVAMLSPTAIGESYLRPVDF